MTVQEDNEGETIEISDEWWEKLTAMPFVSRKLKKILYYRLDNPVIT